jgi:uncharacterized membrane protein
VLIICLGALLCGVGLIIAAPVTFAALSYVYEDLFGAAGSAAEVIIPPTSPVTA